VVITAAMAVVTTTVTPPVTTTTVLLTTTTADGNASLGLSGSDDHAGRERRGVEQNDWSAPHLG
jgi:hypothetical protein